MLENTLLQIDRVGVINFFDDPNGTSRHANAFVAIAGEELGAGLMKHYLENVAGGQVQVLPGSCTPGTQNGGRLDRWMLAQWPDREILFQVEIKNWSANSLDGRNLALNAPPEKVAAHKRERWSRVWNDAEQGLRDFATQKVLMPMKSSRTEKIKPALCMWDAMHPRGDITPWFNIALPSGSHFERLWVFSMSTYL